ncbi:hypothetical protein CR513_07487, partial [Mucuna pruriens]
MCQRILGFLELEELRLEAYENSRIYKQKVPHKCGVRLQGIASKRYSKVVVPSDACTLRRKVVEKERKWWMKKKKAAKAKRSKLESYMKSSQLRPSPNPLDHPSQDRRHLGQTKGVLAR